VSFFHRLSRFLATIETQMPCGLAPEWMPATGKRRTLCNGRARATRGTETVSMAALVWVMTSSASALILSMTLVYRPRWLAWLAGR
jgi:hypothetical protein